MNNTAFSEWLTALPTHEKAALIFMGQAGFIIKDRSDLLYAVDVYFSDCCEREFGFKRLMPKLMEPSEVVFDYVLTTHGHYDHFDVDAMPILMNNDTTALYVTAGGMEECRKLGLTERVTQIEEGGSYKVGNITLTAVYCDHGELAPDAVGFLLDVDGTRILLCGDTAYRPEKMEALKDAAIDLLFVPINGAFGNLNEEEAIAYVELLQPKTVVPCHYGNFKEHGGDVERFNRLFAERFSTITNRNMVIGDSLSL